MKRISTFLLLGILSITYSIGQNVGIGTTSPEYKLHVANSTGEAGVGVNATGTAAQALVNLSIDNRIDGNSLALIKFRSGVAGNVAGIPKSNLSLVAADAGAGALLITTNQASPIHFATNFVERMRILADGTIGIGTATPATQLHMFSSSSPSRLRVETNVGSQDAALELKTGGGVFDFLELRKWMPGSGGSIAGISLAGLSQVTTGSSTTGGLLLGTKIAYPVYFTTSNTERMRIAADGKIGINTNTPNYFLHVEGDNNTAIYARTKSPSQDTSAIRGVLDNTTTAFARASGVRGISTSTTQWSIGVYGTQNGGGWGVAGSVKEAGVSGWGAGVYGEAGLNGSASGTGGYGVFGSNLNTDGIGGYFQNSGAGGKALKTFGAVQLTNIGEAANRVLTSDASGNATWQALPSSASLWALNGNNIYNTNAGNVGIGTTTPTNAFEVKRNDKGSLFLENPVIAANATVMIGRGVAESRFLRTTALHVIASNDRAIVAQGDAFEGIEAHTSSSTTAAGYFSGEGTAKLSVELAGFVKVSGAAANRTAFTITATAGNSATYVLNLPYANQSNTDIVIATHNFGPPGGPNSYNTAPYSVWWNGTNWTIYMDDLSAILNKTFNVLVIKQ